MKFKSYEMEDFLAWAIKVPVEVAVEVASTHIFFTSFVSWGLSQQPAWNESVLVYYSYENTTFFLGEIARLVMGTIF